MLQKIQGEKCVNLHIFPPFPIVDNEALFRLTNFFRANLQKIIGLKITKKIAISNTILMKFDKCWILVEDTDDGNNTIFSL